MAVVEILTGVEGHSPLCEAVYETVEGRMPCTCPDNANIGAWRLSTIMVGAWAPCIGHVTWEEWDVTISNVTVAFR